MSDPLEPSAATDEERWIMSSLNSAGRRAEPSQEQMERWSRAFRDALVDNLSAKRRRRIGVIGVAASVALVAALLLVYRPTGDAPPMLIADVNVAVGVNHLRRPQEGARQLQAGDALLVGDRLRTGSDGGLGLTYHGADVRLGEATEVMLHTDAIELLHGALYVDSRLPPGGENVFTISTRFGSVSHVGTQYLVAVDAGELLSAVREGRIVVVTDLRRLELSTVGSSAELIRVRSDGSFDREQTATHGGLWEWVSQASTGLAVAGRSPHEALSWAARETGWSLQYADDEAAAVAADSRLSGSSVPLSAHQVLRMVSASTRLHVEPTEAGTLHVGIASKDDDDSH